jgi:hypothetical protein
VSDRSATDVIVFAGDCSSVPPLVHLLVLLGHRPAAATDGERLLAVLRQQDRFRS